ncbi:poly [ADP-ribose] polymerase 14 [Patagioenas fasciata monilis]|uniref:Poly [ADP-ribose] polymerase n=1 Tax=Patagioenas fasciata monilis TaxID=372326 RepID=A0A1V4K5R9_PATFA|nr:poly [ADP-ribose] polymerase 14 [Patagioenas fasciata monilis]
MAGHGPGAFPLLVRGNWGAAEPPPALRKKLLCYFQSQKRSGGGECDLRAGTTTGDLLVCFTHPEVRQRVLGRQSHELCLGEKRKLKLIVTEPETALTAQEEALEEKLVPTKALDAMSSLQTKGDTKALQKARSLVPNSDLQEEAGCAGDIAEKPAKASSSVVFENIQDCSLKCLRILLENISNLSVDDDFTVEVIPEINVAVARFIKSIDTEEFVKNCSQNKRVKAFKMSARLLELTQSIKVENLPDGVSADFITIYFENARNGGGPVSDIQLFPEENSAIITFCDHKDVNTVLEKQHFLEQTPISVHPYYHSLGTALYGDRPTIKMPDPIGVPLDPYVWQFLQKHPELIQEINQEMAVCHCELKWPQTGCAHPEITLCPSSSLTEQKKAMIKLIKTWKQYASTEFSCIMSRYIAIKCQVNSEDWGDVKNRLVKDVALIITDISEEMVVIAGKRAAVDSAEKEVRECMEKAMKESKREKQSIEISVEVIPSKYAILRNAGLEENIHKEYPCLKVFYDDTKKTVQLRGLPVEVYKIKADLLEKILNMPHTSVAIDPHVFCYLQWVDNKTISETLFSREKINAFYELEGDTVLLFGHAPKDILEAEKQIKASLEYRCINVEDGEVTKKEQWRSLLASLHKKYNSSRETLVINEPVGKENKVIIAGFSKAVTEVYQKLNDFIERNTHVEKVILAKSAVVVQFVEEEKSNVYCELRKKDVTVCFDTKRPYVPIDKPGAKAFFTDRKDSYVLEAKQKFSCLIRLEEEKQQQKGEKVVDVVVNACNEDLKHISGLAESLLQAAGPELQQECDELETLEESMGDYGLKEIHLVDDVEETVQVLSETEKRKEDLQIARDDLKMITTNEGLRIRVEEKNIQEATTDVIVNSVGTDLKFGVGALCKALLEKAGPTLQVEFDEEKQRQAAGQGHVLCTSGCALACQSVLHAILPMWDGGKGQALKTLEDIINSCLKKTEELGLKSIAFPAIGTGGFKFPNLLVSKLMFDVVFKFSSSHTHKTLQEVHFFLNPSDADNIQAFTTELERRVAESHNAAAPQSGFIKPVSTEGLGVHEMQIGSITVQVITGDITKEDTEVIVNISNPTFDAQGGVFKAIMDAAGSQVEEECRQYAGQLRSGFITTQGGNLLCSKIIHLIHNNNVKCQVTKVLNECQLRMYKSVAFPAIGTGRAGQKPAKVADDMLDAIVEFASKRSVQHLQKIKIVIFQTNMLSDFYESMKAREDSESPTTDSWMSLLKSIFWPPKKSTEKKKPVVLEKKVDLATFQICGESQKNVDATETWIKDLILKEQFENVISDELIGNFDERQIAALAEIQRRNHVTIHLESELSPPCIQISGISRDVGFVSVEVQKMIQEMKDTEEERSRAELVYNLVEWRYPGSNDDFVTFDKLTNMQLEDAKMSNKTHLTVKIKKKNYRVDLNTLQANDGQGETISIQRVSKNEDKLPVQWEDMQAQQVKLVDLKPSCQEYLNVQDKFKKTCPNYVIEKIERIQNPILWQTYQTKKIAVCAKNKYKVNERLLFHGTAASSLRTINYSGFNRGFAGKNAANFGNGTYFAVDACYSAQDIYSKPDTNDRRYMYLARVLTGQYCAGSKGLIMPPSKNPADPTDRYDSVVDDVNNPTMFVVFNDHEAYPEYLITFKK